MAGLATESFAKKACTTKKLDSQLLAEKNTFFCPQIALAIGVLTSSIGVRVRRFFGLVLGGAVRQGVVRGVGGCRAGCRRRCHLGVLNNYFDINSTVFRFNYGFIRRLPGHP